MKWARDFSRERYQPMAPRPDTAFMYCADVPEAPLPVDLRAVFDALAAGFVPDPGRSYEQAQRYEHGDLAGLNEQELWREKQRAAFCAAWLPEGHARTWSEGRLSAVDGEQRRRRAR